MAKYEIIVDTGIPYSINLNSISGIRRELAKLKRKYKGHQNNYPYFDVDIYEGRKDISKRFFKH